MGCSIDCSSNAGVNGMVCSINHCVTTGVQCWEVIAVDYLGCQVMGREAPFGGIQLVLSGDYFQLPPIARKWTPAMGNDAFLNRGYTFQCPAWRRCALQEVLLTKVRDPTVAPAAAGFVRLHQQ